MKEVCQITVCWLAPLSTPVVLVTRSWSAMWFRSLCFEHRAQRSHIWPQRWLNSSRKSILFLKFKTMNVTEQSIMLSSYASGEILSARRKSREGRRYRKAKLSKTRHKVQRKKTTFFTVSRLLVTGDTPTVSSVCGFRLADRISPDGYKN